MESPRLRLLLPYPPSVNHYWRSLGRGRVIISKAGREYRAAVKDIVAREELTMLDSCRLAVTILVWPPDSRVRDLDNLLKAALDGMKHGGVYADDSMIDDLRVVRCPPRPESPRIAATISLAADRPPNGEGWDI